jgi:predicted phosphatase
VILFNIANSIIYILSCDVLVDNIINSVTNINSLTIAKDIKEVVTYGALLSFILL